MNSKLQPARWKVQSSKSRTWVGLGLGSWHQLNWDRVTCSVYASDEVPMVLTGTECNHASSTTCLWDRSYSPFALQSWNNGAVIVLLHVATPAVGTASLEQCTLIASRRIEALSGMLLYFLSPSSLHSVSLLQNCTTQLKLKATSPYKSPFTLLQLH